MPYCPKCKDEFRPGFNLCPDCQCPLVEKLPEKPEPEATHPVPLLIVENQTQMTILEALLRENSIPFYALDEGGGEYLRIVFGNSIFHQTIYVNDRDYARAAEFLAGYYNISPAERVFDLTEEQQQEGASLMQEENSSYKGYLAFLGLFSLFVWLLWMFMR